jgi:hypothetical protein
VDSSLNATLPDLIDDSLIESSTIQERDVEETSGVCESTSEWKALSVQLPLTRLKVKFVNSAFEDPSSAILLSCRMTADFIVMFFCKD